MSVFRDMVETDRMMVFLDPDYFADRHKVDGKEIVCVMDTLTAQGRSDDYGIAEATFILFAATEALPKRKPAGNSLLIDGRSYVIVDWNDEMGITRISLTSAEGM